MGIQAGSIVNMGVQVSLWQADLVSFRVFLTIFEKREKIANLEAWVEHGLGSYLCDWYSCRWQSGLEIQERSLRKQRKELRLVTVGSAALRAWAAGLHLPGLNANSTA